MNIVHFSFFVLFCFPFKTWSPTVLELSKSSRLTQGAPEIHLSLPRRCTHQYCHIWLSYVGITDQTSGLQVYMTSLIIVTLPTAVASFQWAFVQEVPEGLGRRLSQQSACHTSMTSWIQISRTRKTLGADCMPVILAWSSFSLNWMDELWVQRNSVWKK